MDDYEQVVKALNEASVPTANRWAINSKGEAVQITNEYGEPIAPKSKIKEK